MVLLALLIFLIYLYRSQVGKLLDTEYNHLKDGIGICFTQFVMGSEMPSLYRSASAVTGRLHPQEIFVIREHLIRVG
jgi:hypothetical protein